MLTVTVSLSGRHSDTTRERELLFPIFLLFLTLKPAFTILLLKKIKKNKTRHFLFPFKQKQRQCGQKYGILCIGNKGREGRVGGEQKWQKT
jgi:hypothetical protein